MLAYYQARGQLRKDLVQSGLDIVLGRVRGSLEALDGSLRDMMFIYTFHQTQDYPEIISSIKSFLWLKCKIDAAVPIKSIYFVLEMGQVFLTLL
ncbi:MAG: hypothetical protein HUJ51_04285 [Eggerthellaceae bacterium]|nr:hypothetical protein [Eggerthellaceae bacterium]